MTTTVYIYHVTRFPDVKTHPEWAKLASLSLAPRVENSNAGFAGFFPEPAHAALARSK